MQFKIKDIKLKGGELFYDPEIDLHSEILKFCGLTQEEYEKIKKIVEEKNG